MKKTRILIAKPGLDGHDVGAKIVVQALMDAGFEVFYTGLKQSVDDIVFHLREKEVDVLGLSILSGSHLPLCKKVKEKLDEFGINDLLWVVGGNIPKQDCQALLDLGVDGVFPFGTPIQKFVDFISEKVS